MARLGAQAALLAGVFLAGAGSGAALLKLSSRTESSTSGARHAPREAGTDEVERTTSVKDTSAAEREEAPREVDEVVVRRKGLPVSAVLARLESAYLARRDHEASVPDEPPPSRSRRAPRAAGVDAVEELPEADATRAHRVEAEAEPAVEEDTSAGFAAPVPAPAHAALGAQSGASPRGEPVHVQVHHGDVQNVEVQRIEVVTNHVTNYVPMYFIAPGLSLPPGVSRPTPSTADRFSGVWPDYSQYTGRWSEWARARSGAGATSGGVWTRGR